MPSLEEIVDYFKQQESENEERNRNNDEVLNFYAGATYEETVSKGFFAGIVNKARTIFTRKPYDEDIDFNTPLNIIKPAIENKVAFLALQPMVRVIEPPEDFAPQGLLQGQAQTLESPDLPLESPLSPSEGPRGIEIPPGSSEGRKTASSAYSGLTPSQWATKFSDRLEAVIYSLLQFSNFPRRCRDVAWSQCAMDGAVIGVWPDATYKLPRIFTMTPYRFYPEARDPDGLDLVTATWGTKMSGRRVYARWGIDKYIDKHEVEVIQYIDKDVFCTILDGEQWAHPPIKNVMGVVPIVCVGSLGIPGTIFGGNDIKDAIPVAKMLNRHMMLIEEMADAIVKPTIAVREPLDIPDNIAIGSGGVITMGANGDVKLLGPLSLPNAWWQLGMTLQQYFDIVADNPAVLRGENVGSIVTGKGFNAQLGPIAARMQTKLDISLAAWNRVIRYMLEMWANFPGGAAPVKKGVSLGKSFVYIEAEPNEFMINGEIWKEIDVVLDTQSYIDRKSNEVAIMQLLQNEIISMDTAREYVEYVRDKTLERKKVDEDRKWRAEGLAIQNQYANAAVSANPNLADQQMVNYGLERGFIGEAGPAPKREGSKDFGVAPEEVMTMDQTESEEDILDVVIDFFKSIQKLAGSVWIGGAILTNPASIASGNWTVTVWITDPRDKGTITRAAEKVPEIYGRLKFINGRPGADQEAIQVAGPTEPEEEVGGPGKPSPMQMMGIPPEMIGGE